MKTKRGFTLIELLIVIAIIGLLSAVILTSLSTARMKARDARRMSDLNEVKTALELYYTDHGYYPRPSPSCGWDQNCYAISNGGASGAGDWESLETALTQYIPRLPRDPINDGSTGGGSCGNSGPWNDTCYTYSYGNVGRYTERTQYDLTARLEDPNSPHRCGVRDYTFYFTNFHWCTAFGGSFPNQIYEASIN